MLHQTYAAKKVEDYHRPKFLHLKVPLAVDNNLNGFMIYYYILYIQRFCQLYLFKPSHTEVRAYLPALCMGKV